MGGGGWRDRLRGGVGCETREGGAKRGRWGKGPAVL